MKSCPVNPVSAIIRFDTVNIGGIEFSGDSVLGEIVPVVESEVVESIDERDAEEIVTAIGNIRRAAAQAKAISKMCDEAEVFMLARYESALAQFAQNSFAKNKKSVELAAGTIGYRASKERLKIDNHDLAAKVLGTLLSDEDYAEAVRMEPKVLITKIPADAIEQIKDHFGEGVIPDSDVASGFEYVPPVDKFYIKERGL
jgi:hypothetical protein